MKKEYLWLLLIALYLLNYFLLYTYSIFYIEILVPWNLILYFVFVFGTCFLYSKHKNLFTEQEHKYYIILFGILPIFMVTSMFLEPINFGNVTGAKQNFSDLLRYILNVPWVIYKDREVKFYYVIIPTIITVLGVGFMYFKSLYKYIVPVTSLYMLLLIPYLLEMEKFMDGGV